MKKFGYVRVSSLYQNETRQIMALEGYGVPSNNIFVDKKSGKSFESPEYKQLINRLQKSSFRNLTFYAYEITILLPV